MEKEKELQLYKLLAAGAALLYLYKVTKANGGTLKGNSMGVQVQTDNIVKLAAQFVPREFRPHAKVMGSQILNRIMEE